MTVNDQWIVVLYVSMMARRRRKNKMSAKVGWQEIKRTMIFLLRWVWKKLCVLIGYLNPFQYMRTRRRKYKLILDPDGNLIYRPTVWEKMASAFRSDATNRRRLLEWAQDQIPTFRVSDFSTTWSDGVALCALMEAVCPGACPRHDLLKPQHKVNNCRLGLKLAQKHLGITQNIISSEEMANGSVNTELKMRKLVKLIQWASERQGEAPGLQDLPDRPRLLRANSIVKMAASCTAKGTGLVVGIMGKRCKFNVYTNTAELLDLNIEIIGPHGEICNEKIMSVFPTKQMSQILHKDEAKITGASLFRGLFFGKRKLLPLQMEPGGQNEASTRTVDKIPFDYQCVADGHFLVSYIPRSAGPHTVTIKWQGADIKGSPYTVNIAESIEKLNEEAKSTASNRKVSFQEDKGPNKMSYYSSDSVESGVEDDQEAQPTTAAVLTRSSTVHRSISTSGKVALLAKQATVTRRTVLKRVVTKAGQEFVIQEAPPTPQASRQNSSESSYTPPKGNVKDTGRVLSMRTGSPPPQKKNRSFDFELSYESDTSDSTSQASDCNKKLPNPHKLLSEDLAHAMAGIILPELLQGMGTNSDSTKDTSSKSENQYKVQGSHGDRKSMVTRSVPSKLGSDPTNNMLLPPMYDANFKESPFAENHSDQDRSLATKPQIKNEMHSNRHKKLTTTHSNPINKHVVHKPKASLGPPLMPPMAEGRPASDSQLDKMRPKIDSTKLRKTRSASNFLFPGGWVSHHTNGSLGVPNFQGLVSSENLNQNESFSSAAQGEFVGKGGHDEEETGATTTMDEEGNQTVTIVTPIIHPFSQLQKDECEENKRHPLSNGDTCVLEADKENKQIFGTVNVRTQLRSSSDLNLHVKSNRIKRKDSVKKTLSDPSSRSRKPKYVMRSNTSPSSPSGEVESHHLSRQMSSSSTSTKGSDSPSIKVLQSDSLRKTCIYISQRPIMESMNSLRCQVSAEVPPQTRPPETVARSYSVDHKDEAVRVDRPMLSGQTSRRHLRLSTSLPTLSRNWAAFEFDPDDDSLSIEEMQAMSVAAQKKPKRYTLGTSDISDTLEQWQCMENEDIKHNFSSYTDNDSGNASYIKQGTTNSPGSSPGTSPTASRIASRRGSLVRQEVITLQKVSEEDSLDTEAKSEFENKENWCPNTSSTPINGSHSDLSDKDRNSSLKRSKIKGNVMLTVSRAEYQGRTIQIHAPKAKTNRATQVIQDEIVTETGWKRPDKYTRTRRKIMRKPAMEGGSSSLEQDGALGDQNQHNLKPADLPLIVCQKSDSQHYVSNWHEQDGAEADNLPEADHLLQRPVRQSTVDTVDSGIAEDQVLLSPAGSSSPWQSGDIQKKIPPKPRFINGHRAVMRKPYRGKIALDPKLIRNTTGNSPHEDNFEDSYKSIIRGKSSRKTTLITPHLARSVSDSGKRYKHRPILGEDSRCVESDRSKGMKGWGKGKKKKVKFSRRVLMYKRSTSRTYSRQSSGSRQSNPKDSLQEADVKSPFLGVQNENNVLLRSDHQVPCPWSPTTSRGSHDTSSVDSSSSPWFNTAPVAIIQVPHLKTTLIDKNTHVNTASYDQINMQASDCDNALKSVLPSTPSGSQDKQLIGGNVHLTSPVMDQMDPADILVTDSHSSTDDNYDGFGLTQERRTSLLDELSIFSNLTSSFDRTKSEEETRMETKLSLDNGMTSWHQEPSTDSRGHDTHSESETCSEVARLTGHYTQGDQQPQSSVDDLQLGFSSNDELALGFSSNEEPLGRHDASPMHNLFIPAEPEQENPIVAALGENYISFTGLLDTNGINRSMFDSGLGELSDFDELLGSGHSQAEPVAPNAQNETEQDDDYLLGLAYCGVPNPHRVKVYGAALRYGQIGVQNNFQVQTDNAGNGSLTVGVTGPRPYTVTETSITYTGDNIYEVLYDVTEPGYYIITVKWSDFNVPDSPFICKVTY